MPVRKLVRQFLAVAMLGAAPALAGAQELGTRPITILTGLGAGSGTDIAARALAARISPMLNVPVVVENRPGANSLVAIRALLASKADGHTLLLGAGGALASNPGLDRSLSYDPLKDFTLVASVFKLHGLMVVGLETPFRTVKELVAYAKQNPGKLNYGSSGIGTGNHLAMEYFLSETGTSMVHVPLKGDNQVAAEILAGRVQVGIPSLPTGARFLKDGKLRALAVMSANPVPQAPGVPSLRQIGVPGLDGMEPMTFLGMVGPAGIPPKIVAQINKAINDTLTEAAFRERSESLGFEPMPDTVDGFRSFLQTEIAKWRQMSPKIKLDVVQ